MKYRIYFPGGDIHTCFPRQDRHSLEAVDTFSSVLVHLGQAGSTRPNSLYQHQQQYFQKNPNFCSFFFFFFFFHPSIRDDSFSHGSVRILRRTTLVGTRFLDEILM